MGIAGLVLAIIVTVIVITVAVYRKKADILINYTCRIAAGLLGIYLINMILEMLSVSIKVGINGTSVLVLGTLGAPGFLMLYGICTYFALK